MNLKKPILYLLLIVLGLVLLYNYIIAPNFVQYGNEMGMGMGMHWKMYNQNNYYIDSRIIVLLVILILGLIIYEFLKPQQKKDLCRKCGNKIESDKWKICPFCGTTLYDKRS